MLIYKITNNINNKIYIGQTSQTFEKRIKQYKDDVRSRPESRPIIKAIKNMVLTISHLKLLKIIF